MKHALLGRILGAGASIPFYFALTTNIAAGVSSTPSAGKGGTGGALPTAGSTELTYFLFLLGVILFIVGSLKLVQNWRD